MIIANGNVINIAPAGHDWIVAFELGDDNEITCPVIGWATVAKAQQKDGTVPTTVEPAFLWGDMVWTETELREHSPIVRSYEIRAREITHTTTKENQ